MGRLVHFRKTPDGYRWIGEMESYEAPGAEESGPAPRERITISYQVEPVGKGPTNQLHVAYYGSDTKLAGRTLTLEDVRPVLAEWDRRRGAGYGLAEVETHAQPARCPCQHMTRPHGMTAGPNALEPRRRGRAVHGFTAQQHDRCVPHLVYGLAPFAAPAACLDDIEPGGWIYKDRTLQVQTMFQKLSTGLFASAGQICWNRFTGPGKIALQSMYFHMASGE